MRSNTMKTCAVGAMLFGGTLGVNSIAEAGLTWKAQGLGTSATDSSTGPSFNYAQAGYYDVQTAEGASALNAFSYTNQGRTVSFSATTASGFSMSINTGATPDPYGAGGIAKRFFSVAAGSSVVLDLTTTGLQSSSFLNGWQIWKYNGASYQPAAGIGNQTGYLPVSAGVSTSTVTLGAGEYWVRLSAIVGTSYNGVAGTLTVVPAPGAIALLGAAGLVAGRRRRD
jgi:MYXO-CTERM domain-containing protein